MLVGIEHRGFERFPVDQVCRAGMAPRHVPPILGVGIMLVIEVPIASVPDETVGVAEPVDRWTEVEAGSDSIRWHGQGFLIANHDE